MGDYTYIIITWLIMYRAVLLYLFWREVDVGGTANGVVDELGSIAPSGWPLLFEYLDSASLTLEDDTFDRGCWSSRLVLALLLLTLDEVGLFEETESLFESFELGATRAVGLAWWFLVRESLLVEEVASWELILDEFWAVPFDCAPDDVYVPPLLAAVAWSSAVGVRNLISLLTDPSPPITVRVIWTVPPFPVEKVVVWVLTPLPI